MQLKSRRIAVAALAALLGLAGLACRTSMYSGLPRHIRTVEVHIFQNKTMHKGVEARLTRDIIDSLNADPMVRVTSRNGDALITGEIKDVRRITLRETTTGEAGTVQIAIDVTYSFYDQVQRRYIAEDVEISSSTSAMSPGIYEASRGGTPEDGESGASRQLAAEIVRRTIGMW